MHPPGCRRAPSWVIAKSSLARQMVEAALSGTLRTPLHPAAEKKVDFALSRVQGVFEKQPNDVRSRHVETRHLELGRALFDPFDKPIR